MISVDAYFKALSTLVTALLAATLLPAVRRQPAARYLVAFLLLVSLNQGAETLRALASSPGERLVWFRVASIAASMDPAAFLLFVSAFTSRSLRFSTVLLVAICSATLALWGGWMVSDIPAQAGSDAANARVFPFVLDTFTMVVYIRALFLVSAQLLSQPRDPRWAWIFAAASSVVLPAIPRPLDHVVAFLYPIFYDGRIDWLSLLLRALGLAVAVFAGAYAVRRSGHPLFSRKPTVPQMGVLVGAGVLAVSDSVLLVSTFLDLGWVWIPAIDYSVAGRAAAAIRWVFFGAFASAAFLRGDPFDIGLPARRRSARVLIGIVVLYVAGIVLLLLDEVGGRPLFGLGDAVALLGALALSQSFRGLVDRVAERAYGVLPPIGTDPAAASPGGLQEGRLILGRYRVERLLGAGGGGRTFLARDTILSRDVALKEIPPDEKDELAVREARAAGMLQHKNVVTVYDFFRLRDAYVLVTEYAPGGTIDREMRAGRLAHEQRAQLAHGIIEGMAAVHAQGIVHGDLKPANILLGKDGEPKIADFGLARVRTGFTVSVRESSTLIGTPGYMAPEQEQGKPATPASDVYSLGLVLLRLLDGFTDEATIAVLRRATEHDPSERWTSAIELRAALVALQRQ